MQGLLVIPSIHIGEVMSSDNIRGTSSTETNKFSLSMSFLIYIIKTVSFCF